MRNALKWSALVLLILGLTGIATWAQMGGGLQGRVVDEAGQPVVGATIQVKGPSLQGFQGAATDLNGKYIIPFLPVGQGYEVKVEAPGYNTVVRKGISVVLGTTISLPFTLSQGKTEIVVTAAAPVMDLKSTSIGASIGTGSIDNLPLGRNANNIAFLAPTAVSSGPSTPDDASLSGSTGAENNYVVNGVDLTNTAYGTSGLVAGGERSLGQAGLNFEFIKAVDVLTGGMPPEYGFSTGGVVNAITQEGGNEYHGSLFAYYWNDSMQAKTITYPYVINTAVNSSGFTIYDIGGSIGGYFIKDKLWFFVAADYNYEKDKAIPPLNSGDTKLYLNGKPATSGYAGQELDTTSKNPQYAAKLTWNINPNHKLAISVFGNNLKQDGFAGLATKSLISAPYNDKWDALGLSAQWNATWTPKFFSEAVVSYKDNKESLSVNSYAATIPSIRYAYSQGVYGGFHAYPADTSAPPVSVAPGNVIDLGSNWKTSDGAGGLFYVPKDNSAQLRLKFTNILGKHELSYGAQYMKNLYTLNFQDSGNPNWVSPYNHLPAIGGGFIQWTAHSAAQGPYGNSNSYYRFRYQDYYTPTGRATEAKFGAIWVNDNWSLTDYFTLKLGLRWDAQTLKSLLKEGDVIQLNDNFSPRVGFTWDVMHSGKSKFYGFYGQYVERVPTDMAIRSLAHEYSGYEYFYDAALTQPAGIAFFYGAQEFIQGQNAYAVSLPNGQKPYNGRLESPMTEEYLIGYQQQVTPDFTVGGQIVYRNLIRTIEDISADGANTYIVANPDKWSNIWVPGLSGGWYHFPKPTRRYSALQLTAQKRLSHNWEFYASYVLSRLEGNYEGASSNDTTTGQNDPNLNATYDIPELLVNGQGILPLDRTHQVKAYGSYHFPNIPLVLSANFTLNSGTPISKQVWYSWYGGSAGFLTPRGSDGRTPTTWTLDVGAQYNFPIWKSNLGVRVDIFNITNETRTVSVYQQYAYQTDPGGPIYQNLDPSGRQYFKRPYAAQAPRTVRFALRWTF